MEEKLEFASVVIDNGSGIVKAGFAGDDAPKSVFTGIVGVPKYDLVMEGVRRKKFYIADEVEANRGILKVSYPIAHGVVTDWDAMEKIWHHVYYTELRVRPEDYPVLLTEAPLNPKANRERMVNIMFNKLKVPSLYVSIQAVLALYASGRISGLVLDSGDGVSHTVPIYNGYMLPHAVLRMDLAGRDLTEYLAKLLSDAGYPFKTTAERELVKHMKQELCYVSDNYHKELEDMERCRLDKPELGKIFKLPDGSSITLFEERFKCPELLFKPHICGFELTGVHEFVADTIRRCDLETRPVLFENIILSGGSTMFPNFPERLETELQPLAPPHCKVKVLAQAERKYSVWIGGSILASLASFQACWVKREEYDVDGPTIVHKRCK